jgi:hypothetical protein
MSTPGGAGTTLGAALWVSTVPTSRARRTGFYHGVGAFSLLGSGPSSCPHSPKCVEGKFCEVELPLYGILGSLAHERCRAPLKTLMSLKSTSNVCGLELSQRPPRNLGG